jgi:hypothetical protein
VPDDSPRLTDVLERLASAAQADARTRPPSVLRRRAARRTARNGSIVAAVAVLAVVAGFSVASGSFRTASTDQQPSRPTATAATGPVPTQLATLPSTGVNSRHIDPSMLVTEAQVSMNLGSSWPWTAAPASDGSKPLTPCQATAGDDPSAADRRTAMSEVVTGGWSGDDTFSQLLEEYPDAASARRAYASAVDWFASCNGLGVDQTDDPHSLARLAAAHMAIKGVDDMRIIVRMRAKVGAESWTNTVAAVVRAGNLVTVLAWDVTIDDNPGVYDGGFVALSWQLAHQLADTKDGSLLDGALLAADDPAVSTALGGLASGDHHTTHGERDGILRMDPLCNGGLTPPPPGTAGAGGAQMIGPTGVIVLEDVAQYPFVESARAAADAAIADASACPPAKILPGSRRDLAVDVGPHGGAWIGTRTDSPDQTRLTAVVTSGPLVAYLLVDSGDAAIPDDQARAVVEAAAARLASAAGH